MQENKNKNDIKVTQHKGIYMVIKSKMSNRLKSAKQIRCAKTVYWDLININMNKRDVQTGCTGCVHIAAIRMMYRVCTHI